MRETSDDLARQCGEALRDTDFPTVWQTILKSHRLVVGPPVQYLDGDRTELHVRLLTGQRLVFDFSAKTCRVL